MTRGLILSVKPRYARTILDGSKTAELRTRPVAVPEGTQLIVYATAPVRAILGTALLKGVIKCSPEVAWKTAGRSLLMGRADFDRYTSGHNAVSVLLLDYALALDEPIPLAALRNGHRFQPPQAYRYVSPLDPVSLRALLMSGDAPPST